MELENIAEIEIKEEKRTFAVNTDLIEQMELEAYWDRKSLKEVLNDILKNHYQNKKLKPFPPTYKKAKRGRKPA